MPPAGADPPDGSERPELESEEIVVIYFWLPERGGWLQIVRTSGLFYRTLLPCVKPLSGGPGYGPGPDLQCGRFDPQGYLAAH